jgi:hypothetical protein
MSEEKITGVRVYILTVDSETNTVLKCQEQDPNTGQRTELDPNFELVPVQYPPPETLIPAGFVPSIVILVGGQVSAVSQSLKGGEQPPRPRPPRPPPIIGPKPSGQPARAFARAAEDKQADKGGPPKV